LDAYVLGGTATRVGSAFRLSCHLESPSGPETIWSDRFDRELSVETFMSAQDELAGYIASRLADPALGVLSRCGRSAEQDEPGLRAMSSFFQFVASPSLPRMVAARSALEKALPHAGGAPLIHAAYSCALSLDVALCPSS